MSKSYNLGRVAGYSAYELAVQDGYKGTQSEWIESLHLRFEDLTDADIAELQKPAVEATVDANAAAKKATDTEASVSKSEAARVTAEEARRVAEAGRVSAEGARDSAELARYNAEVNRELMEDKRDTAEAARRVAEIGRVSTETARVNAEASRVAAETARVNVETARVNAEESRVSAEGDRVTAEIARDNAEVEREIAEAARVEQYDTLDARFDSKLSVSDLAQGVGGSDIIPMSQAAATAAFLKRGDVDLEQLLAYGVEFDTTVSSPTCTRIGNMSLHRTLPIQSKMRGCLLNDNGAVNRYLPHSSWVGEELDGSDGQVMVELAAYYRCFKALNATGEFWDWANSEYGADYNAQGYTRRQVWLSEQYLKGYKHVNNMYVSAYEASLQRSTNKLASVMNLDADYRGGGNNTAYDDTYRSFLGRPATNISLTSFRTYARNRKANNTEWNCMTYEAHKTIFWLFTVEYATLNCQSAINAELTADGYKQGGLGNGVTTLSSTQWSDFNGYYPFVPCGHTNALGNGTGEVAYNMVDENGDDYATIYSNRYRGIENTFGHIWQWTDGILVDVRTDDYDGNYAGQNRVLVAQDPADFASHSTLADSYEGYEFRGLQARTSSSYIKEIIFGEFGDMMGEVVGGSSTTFFCDYNYTSVTSSSMRGVRFGGDATHGSSAGFAYSYSHLAPSTTATSVGSRLCFIPAE